MSLHNTTRVPIDDEYAALLGKAIYVFAYYEWVIIYIIEYLEDGFVYKYFRGNPMTSGAVKNFFLDVINNPFTSFSKVTKNELTDCCVRFEELIIKRNALIHAHPYTASNGEQRLAYQTKPSKPLSDIQWSSDEIGRMISEFDEAACQAGEILDKLRR